MKTKPKTYWIAKSASGKILPEAFSDTKKRAYELLEIYECEPSKDLFLEDLKKSCKIVKVKLVEVK